ncbi:hypothetical protein RJT34_19955 [Clitoria ternatea]|uniref:Ribulose bisphosphate carboxylase/oxygenase activase, chloroplastic n=1 Tax=Clitoria ternatea TaxID=43366 RepID=A0AAN9IS50_CLITE
MLKGDIEIKGIERLPRGSRVILIVWMPRPLCPILSCNTQPSSHYKSHTPSYQKLTSTHQFASTNYSLFLYNTKHNNFSMAASVSTVGVVNRTPLSSNGSVAGASVPSSAFFGSGLKKVTSRLPNNKLSYGSFKVVAVEKEIEEDQQTDKDRWRGLAYDISDDQQDITRGKGMVDSLFQAPMDAGTHYAVMSSYEYLSTGLRQLDNKVGGFYIAPAFMDKLVVHITKNFMTLPNIKVPLILGIWGGKGQGKSFQCELVFAKMGINPIMMSAGELESGNAGEPAKLIRQRYREAADIIRKGKMCALFINDLDAGAGPSWNVQQGRQRSCAHHCHW